MQNNREASSIIDIRNNRVHAGRLSETMELSTEHVVAPYQNPYYIDKSVFYFQLNFCSSRDFTFLPKWSTAHLSIVAIWSNRLFWAIPIRVNGWLLRVTFVRHSHYLGRYFTQYNTDRTPDLWFWSLKNIQIPKAQFTVSDTVRHTFGLLRIFVKICTYRNKLSTVTQ